MEAKRANGSMTWKWVVGMLVTLCGMLAMGFGGYLKGEMSDVAERIEGHAERAGHPVVLERINFMRDDIDEIKTEQREIKRGVNELLRRVPPK